MGVNLLGRSFLKLLDFSSAEIRYLLDLSKELKKLKMTHTPHDHLKGKNIVLLFEKTSTRTRCSFEVAAMDLGMGSTFLDPASSQMGHKESIEDTARVLGRMYDGIEYRGFSQEIVEKGIKLTFVGDARNNVANSLMVVCAKMGMHFTACGPKDLFPAADLVKTAEAIAKETGATITLTDDVEKGCKNADVLYTDIWVSMGEPDSVWESRIKLLSKYQVNKKMMALANPNAIFLHCLPSFHDLNTKVGREVNEKFGIPEMEVSNEVFESVQSKVFDQAENRMHTIKAVMYATLK